MAVDGSIIIDTKLDTDGIDEGSAHIQEQYSQIADAAGKMASTVSGALNDIDVGDVAEGMSESFAQESAEIEAILSDNEKSAKAKAASIAAVYRKQGLSQSDAMKKAWEKIERTSKTSSKKIQEHIDDIGDKSESVGKNVSNNLSGGISSAVKKIGGLITAGFAIRTLVNFGKEAVSLGSDLQEVQNVVDVTFTTMSDKVDEFAESAAASAGLSETMAKKYAGTFGAMAKSFGFAESEAFDMSTSLTQLTGDVASFYNITQDEANTKLKSVFTGETESLKELGVVMTQSALDAFAMAKGYGKTTDAMSEQEKVALRYQFVMDKLSGAQGDFVRTSDGWANQVRVLKLNVESFMATIGQGIINLLTPVIKALNSLFTLLQKVANQFKEWTETITGNKSSVSSGMSSAADSAGAITDSMEETAAASKKIKNNLSGLDEIRLWSSDDDSAATADSIVSTLNGVSGDMFATGTAESGASLSQSITNAVEAVEPAIMELGKALAGIFPLLGEIISTLLPPLSDIIVSIVPVLTQIIQTLLPPLNQLLQAFLPMVTNWVNAILPPLTEILTIVIGLVGQIVESILPLFISYGAQVSAFTTELINMVLPFIVDLLNMLVPIILNIVDAIMPIFVSLMNAVMSILNALLPILQPILDLILALLDPLLSFVDFVLTPIQYALDALCWVINNVVVPAITWLVEKCVERLTKNFNILKSVITVIGNVFKTVWNAIKGVWAGAASFFGNIFTNIWNKVSTTLTNIKSKFSSIFNAIKTVVKTPINAIIGFINGLISGVTDGINSVINAMNKLSWDIPDWVPVMGGKKFGFDLKTITAPQIPYLATGAVIPPNAPFAAVLGDQRHGNNLEAPESLIRKIVREEAGNGGFRGTVTIPIYIGGKKVYELVINEAKLKQMQTGKNPFALA